MESIKAYFSFSSLFIQKNINMKQSIILIEVMSINDLRSLMDGKTLEIDAAKKGNSGFISKNGLV
jgi:hypothetical protein